MTNPTLHQDIQAMCLQGAEALSGDLEQHLRTEVPAACQLSRSCRLCRGACIPAVNRMVRSTIHACSSLMMLFVTYARGASPHDIFFSCSSPFLIWGTLIFVTCLRWEFANVASLVHNCGLQP